MVNIERLKRWREEAGLSQKAAAEAFGVSQSCLWYWENGEKVPGLEAAFAVERATNGEVPAHGWVATPSSAA